MPLSQWQDISECPLWLWLPLWLTFERNRRKWGFLCLLQNSSFIHSFILLFILSFIQEIFTEYLLYVDISGHVTPITPSKSPLISFWDIYFPPLFENSVGWWVKEALSSFRRLMTPFLIASFLPSWNIRPADIWPKIGWLDTFSRNDKLWKTNGLELVPSFQCWRQRGKKRWSLSISCLWKLLVLPDSCQLQSCSFRLLVHLLCEHLLLLPVTSLFPFI